MSTSVKGWVQKVLVATAWILVGCSHEIDSTPVDTSAAHQGIGDGDRAPRRPVPGPCIGPAAVNCDDGIACTVDSCVAGVGCVHTPDDAPCNDSNVCTIDTCDVVKGCVATAVSSPTSCNDGSSCTTQDHCAGGVCVGELVQCDDGNQCTVDSCDPLSGCVFAPAGPVPCNDGNACTTSDVCSGTTCVAGGFLNCNDGNSCTYDLCSPAAGCVYTVSADGVPCQSDGNACNGAETCLAGSCVVKPVDCDDHVDCTTDSCNPTFGCINFADDLKCGDGNACTQDRCSRTLGCVNLAFVDGTPCPSDGNACNGAETCVSGSCLVKPVDCDDHVDCTTDACNPTFGCINFADDLKCGDGNACTTDRCSSLGCTHGQAPAGLPCNDGSQCTGSDVCVGTTCVGTAIDCEDYNPCTADSCDLETGCGHVAVADGTSCSDNNACTGSDLCSGGTCRGNAINCDDSIACTVDFCHLSFGCLHTPDASGCDDGNPCTVDSCGATGCEHSPAGSIACNDDDLCTTGDTCVGTSCVGTPATCNDGNPCTTDSCDPVAGCSAVPLPDGSPCSNGDGSCQAGSCAPYCSGISSPYVWATPIVTTLPGVPFPPAIDAAFNPQGRSVSYFAQGDGAFALWNDDAPGCSLPPCTGGSRVWTWFPPPFPSSSRFSGSPGLLLRSLSILPPNPQELVYLSGSDGILYSLDANTGLPPMTVPQIDTRRRINGSLVCSTVPGDGLGPTTLAQRYADSDSRFKSSADALPGHSQDDVVFVATRNGCGDTTRNRVLAFWASDLSPKWTFNADFSVKLGAGVGCSLDVGSNALFCAADLPAGSVGQSSLFAIDTVTGAARWAHNAGSLRTRPILHQDRLYVATTPGSIVALSKDGNGLGSGQQLWSVPATGSGAIFASDPAIAVLAESFVVVLAIDSAGRLVIVKDLGSSGQLLQSLAPEAGVSYVGTPVFAPAVSRIYVARDDGKIQQIVLSPNALPAVAQAAVEVTLPPGSPGLSAAALDSPSALRLVVASDTATATRLALPFCSGSTPF